MKSAGATDRILDEIERAATLYQRLVLVVTASKAAASAALGVVAARREVPLVNLSLELSKLLLDLPQKERPLRLHALLEDLLTRLPSEEVLLDHLELLFADGLAQDLLRLLQQLSRARTVVAAWPGRLEAGELVHAEPWHPEYRHHPAHELALVYL